jgi:hypothetical protein
MDDGNGLREHHFAEDDLSTGYELEAQAVVGGRNAQAAHGGVLAHLRCGESDAQVIKENGTINLHSLHERSLQVGASDFLRR